MGESIPPFSTDAIIGDFLLTECLDFVLQWLDPKTGIAAVLLVNVRPHGDAVVAKLYDQLEFAVYKELLPPKGKI